MSKNLKQPFWHFFCRQQQRQTGCNGGSPSTRKLLWTGMTARISSHLMRLSIHSIMLPVVYGGRDDVPAAVCVDQVAAVGGTGGREGQHDGTQRRQLVIQLTGLPVVNTGQVSPALGKLTFPSVNLEKRYLLGKRFTYLCHFRWCFKRLTLMIFFILLTYLE